MKNRLILIAALLCVVMVFAASCGKSAMTPDEASTLYAPVLDDIFIQLTEARNDEFTITEGLIGISEVGHALGAEAAVQHVGYTFKDVNDDGVIELLIGDMGLDQNLEQSYTSLYAVYTIADNAPKLLFDGYARNRYCFLGDGRFCNEGSGGAAYSGLGTFVLKADASELVCEEYLLTAPNEASPELLDIYRNTTGSFDYTEAEKTELTIDEFWKRGDELLKNAQKLTLTPFAGLD